MRILITPIAAAIAAIAFLTPQTASAAHNSPLYHAAYNYREAVRELERAVNRSPYLDRYAERLADELEDATSRLRSAARRPEHLDRLLSEWQQIQVLHVQVKSVVFANPNCPSRAELLPFWERVSCAYRDLVIQITPFCAAPIGHGAVAFRPPCYDDPCPLPGLIVPNYRVPNYQAPNYQAPNYQAPRQQVPNYRFPNQEVPNYRAPRVEVPNYRYPNRVTPQTAPGERPLTHPTRSLNQGMLPLQSGIHSGVHAYGNARYSDRDTGRSPASPSPVYSYKGIGASRIGALISRLAD